MPTFDYSCRECGAAYDVFHKVREVVEDIVCPSCGSTSHRKLMSVPAAAVTKAAGASVDSCATGGGSCCGGMCSTH